MPDARRARRIAAIASGIVSDLFDRLEEGGLVDKVALAEAEAEADGIVAHHLSGLDFEDMWWEFLNLSMCSLCAQTGVIDTRGISTPGGAICGARAYCICPNGRAHKAEAGLKPGDSSVVEDHGTGLRSGRSAR